MAWKELIQIGLRCKWNKFHLLELYSSDYIGSVITSHFWKICHCSFSFPSLIRCQCAKLLNKEKTDKTKTGCKFQVTFAEWTWFLLWLNNCWWNGMVNKGRAKWDCLISMPLVCFVTVKDLSFCWSWFNLLIKLQYSTYLLQIVLWCFAHYLK